jgi:hypothetical protein
LLSEEQNTGLTLGWRSPVRSCPSDQTRDPPLG